MKRFLFLLFPVGVYSWLIFCISYSMVSEENVLQPTTEVQTAAIASELRLPPDHTSWRTDPAIRIRIKNARQLSAVFAAGNQVNSLEACQQLGKKLKTELKPLFQNCTDPTQKDLCLFLKPIAQDVKILQGKDLQASAAALLRLKERLSVYQTLLK